MASTKTTIYSIYGRETHEDSFHGDTVNLDLSQGRSGAYQATTRIGALSGDARHGSQSGQAYVYDNIARQPEVPPVHVRLGNRSTDKRQAARSLRTGGGR